LPGLTTKVQHHYFRRMVELGVLNREVHAEVPPRVEYRLTPFGERLVPLLEQIEQLQKPVGDGSRRREWPCATVTSS
jgi:DNA-binding HxlR family transcriptional regulator